ncbi:MAG: amylo-alpha-1,6-glucosidase [Myxococcota bacterium]|nr:amylo-alpha-1,6-glucosidase [Myxococcota bacterium]
MSELNLRVPPPSAFEPPAPDDLALEEDPSNPFVTREWLVTNSLGGYASGTLAGIATRRFHGLLMAALPAPLGRTMMLAHLGEVIRLPDGRAAHLGPQPRLPLDGRPLPLASLIDFQLEYGLPVWRYDALGTIVERRISMPHQQNTLHVSYNLASGRSEALFELEAWIRFRPHDGALDAAVINTYALTVVNDRYEVSADGYPLLRMLVDGAPSAFTIDRKRMRDVRYDLERIRGYDSKGELHSPGFFRMKLAVGAPVTLVASTEAWETIDALPPAVARGAERERRTRLLASAPPAADEAFSAQLVLAADQFLITPTGRSGDAARAHAVGDEVRTVIAGYHWFTDWGRDTMISLEGLTLVTGRTTEARYILRAFAGYLRDGLIPNMFPEHGREGLYHTADATLWFFHAIDRYLHYTHDRDTLRLLLPKLTEIVEKHLAGTRFNIGVDPRDGLLTQGEHGYALTWMDAKVGDLVVTPRRGKAVEINALWYNALRLLQSWVEEEHGAGAGRPYAELAERARDSFNARFWYSTGGYLYDVVDGENGNDTAFRPNQIFAVALTHAVLDETRWSRIVHEVRARLVTPVGLRSLEPGHPDFKAKYFGDLHARDLAYHQGTVWAWLIGPFVDAWLKVGGDRTSARELLQGLEAHLTEGGVGSISEIFDAEPPFTPRGCIAQAWSVAEVLRCLVKTAG